LPPHFGTVAFLTARILPSNASSAGCITITSEESWSLKRTSEQTTPLMPSNIWTKASMASKTAWLRLCGLPFSPLTSHMAMLFELSTRKTM